MPVPHVNLDHQFQAVINLYKTLASRFKKSRLFLPRTLWRDSHSIPETPPTIFYSPKDKGITWNKHVKRMRCLWCRDSFYRFASKTELLDHLRRFHSRFTYTSGESLRAELGGKTRQVDVIYMELLEAEEGIRQTAVDRLHDSHEEPVPANNSRACGKERHPKPGDKRFSSSEDDRIQEPPPKRLRPVRSCVASVSEEDKQLDQRTLEPRRRSALGSTHPPASKTTADAKDSRKTTAARAKLPTAKFAYKSVEDAIENGRLFHSVVQTPLNMDDIQAESDSDAEDHMKYEREWRLALANDEVDDFTDTLPVEKLFFNLWNQFLTLDFHAYADKTIAPGCLLFAKKYRRIIQELHMELPFLRHLSELRRIGLLDASALFNAMMVLKDRDPAPKSKEEEGARFFFAEEVQRKARAKNACGSKAPDPGRPMC